MSGDLTTKSQYLIFTVAEHPCAVLLSEVREVVLMAELSQSLVQADTIEGILNLGGEAIPVLKLNRILGLKDWSLGLYSHIIVAKSQDRSLGFLTQSAYKIASFASDDLTLFPTGSTWNGCVSALIREGKEFINILSFAQITARFHENIMLHHSLAHPLTKEAV